MFDRDQLSHPALGTLTITGRCPCQMRSDPYDYVAFTLVMPGESGNLMPVEVPDAFCPAGWHVTKGPLRGHAGSHYWKIEPAELVDSDLGKIAGALAGAFMASTRGRSLLDVLLGRKPKRGRRR